MKTVLFKSIRSYMHSSDDPFVEGLERHVFLVSSDSIPEEIPLDPNPRKQNINQKVYREVLDSLVKGTRDRSGDRTPFHLKNQGMLIVAHEVQKIGKDLLVTFKSGQGALNGGHSHKIVASKTGALEEPQFLKVEINVGVPEKYLVAMAKGNNTGIQTTQSTIYNLDGLYDWIKELLVDTSSLDKIQFEMNEENKNFDVRDIVSTLAILDPTLDDEKDPSKTGQMRHPSRVYSNRNILLDNYKKNIEDYQKFRDILKEVLFLRDYIQKQSPLYWNEDGGKAGRCRMFDRTVTDLIFMEDKSEYKFEKAILYPILSSFRQLIEENKNGTYQWKIPFNEIVKVFDRYAVTFLKKTQDSLTSHTGSITQVGKDVTHWDNLYSGLELFLIRNKII